jgi:hypothetical protein
MSQALDQPEGAGEKGAFLLALAAVAFEKALVVEVLAVAFVVRSMRSSR